MMADQRKGAKTLKIMENIKELNEMTTKELETLLEQNTKLYWELRNEVDKGLTYWEAQDLFVNCPNIIDEDNYKRLYLNPRYFYISNYDTTMRWLEDLIEYTADYDFLSCYITDYETQHMNADYYLDTMYKDYYGEANISYKDYRYMEDYVIEFLTECVEALNKYYHEILDRFNEEHALADYLVDYENDLLGNYYIEDGTVYRREYDRAIA